MAIKRRGDDDTDLMERPDPRGSEITKRGTGIEPFAASPLTVTVANPTPPTNFASTGGTPPNPATYDPTVYIRRPIRIIPRPDLAPFYDDGLKAPSTRPMSARPGRPRWPPRMLPSRSAAPAWRRKPTGAVVVVTAPGSVATAPTQSVSVDGQLHHHAQRQPPKQPAAGTLATITSISPNNVAVRGRCGVDPAGQRHRVRTGLHRSGQQHRAIDVLHLADPDQRLQCAETGNGGNAAGRGVDVRGLDDAGNHLDVYLTSRVEEWPE